MGKSSPVPPNPYAGRTRGWDGIRAALLASAVLIGTSCDDPTAPPEVASVGIIPATWTFTSVGDTLRFRAEAKSAGGAIIPGHSFRWRAEPSGVVGVRQDGLVTAFRSGVVVLTATADSVTGTADVDVAQAVASIFLQGGVRLTAIGDSTRLFPTAMDARSNPIAGATFSFRSLDERVATVSSNGTVKAVGAGVAPIVVTSSDKADTAAVEVRQEVVSIEMTPDTTVMEEGTTRQLTAVMKDRNGYRVTDRSPEWRSTDTLGVRVTGSGLATAVGTRLGTIAVIATSDGASRSAPVYVFTRFVAVSTGLVRTCALSSRGRMYCWGWAVSEYPLAVPGAPAFSSIVAGFELSCGLTAEGEAYCWQTPLSIASPAPVSSSLRFSSLAAGHIFIYGLTSTGALYSWSRAAPSPTLVPGGVSFSSISTQILDACATVSSGAAYCWGSNLTGALGIGTYEPRSEPTPVLGGHSFAQVTMGGGHVCGITVGGATYCWGRNSFGGFGDGTRTESLVPVPGAAGLTLSSVTTADFHSCGLDASGVAYCWGLGERGQIGDGTFEQMRLTPVAVSGGLIFTSISSASQHTCGVTATGALYCWGRNDDRQLGDGTSVSRAVPTRVAGGPP